MRKLFIILLLVSLVPFTVGCNGIFDNDDDDSSSYWPATTVASVVKFSTTASLPSGTTASNIRAAISTNAPTMLIGGKLLTGVQVGTNLFKFETTFTKTELETVTGDTFADGAVELPFTLAYTVNGVRYQTPGKTKVSNVVASKEATEAVNETKVVITVAGGAATVTYVPSGSTAEETIEQTGYDTVQAFQVATAVAESKELTTSYDTAVELTSLTPSVTLTFTSTPDNVSTANWTIRVAKVTQTVEGDYESGETIVESVLSSYELNSTDNASLFNVTSENNTVTITLADNATYKLSAGYVYKVEVVSTNLTAGGALLEPVVVYFKTAGTAAAAATLTNINVNGADIAKDNFSTTTTNIPVESTTVQGKTVITLTFDQAITTKPTAGSVTLERTAPTAATFNFALTDATIEIANGKLVVTFDQPLTNGASYEATLNSATWDGVNTPVTTIKFSTVD